MSEELELQLLDATATMEKAISHLESELTKIREYIDKNITIS